MAETTSKQFLRGLKFPFCSGCGLFGIIDSFLKAVQEAGYDDLNKFVFCSGIGCSSWIPSPYFLADSVHTLHGRSIPVASGIKLMRPDLNVIVFGGDGDIMGIGLGHFIHAARRNLDIMVVMGNNMVYGMTGGQVAPTTPIKTKTTTTPYGSFEKPFDAAKLALAAGAAYSARWTTAHLKELRQSLKNAINLDGFRFIEVVSHCPTAFGRRIGLDSPGAMVKWFKDHSVSMKQAAEMSEEKLRKKIMIGELGQRERPTLVQNVYAILKEAQTVEETD